MFKELGLKEEIVSTLSKMGYTEPTKIQSLTIQAFNTGKNIVGQSQTGTGKTAAFILPTLNEVDSKKKVPQVLILAPTRELVSQTREEIINLSQNQHIRSLEVYGGSNIMKQKEILEKGPQFVVGTPGRIIDLIKRGFLKLDSIDYFVLDEADRMLDMGFKEDIDYIWSSLKNLKQSMSFSATITNDLKHIIKKYIGNDYEPLKASEEMLVDEVNHFCVDMMSNDKEDTLIKYLDEYKGEKVLIFTETKSFTSQLKEKLSARGIKVDCLHGDIRQKDRFKIINSYKNGNTKVLIATDVAARGLNMNDIKLVVNYDVPSDPESYVHRIGRTARAGETGTAVMFMGKNDKGAVKNIEQKNKIKINIFDKLGNETKLPKGGFSKPPKKNHNRKRNFKKTHAYR